LGGFLLLTFNIHKEIDMKQFVYATPFLGHEYDLSKHIADVRELSYLELLTLVDNHRNYLDFISVGTGVKPPCVRVSNKASTSVLRFEEMLLYLTILDVVSILSKSDNPPFRNVSLEGA